MWMFWWTGIVKNPALPICWIVMTVLTKYWLFMKSRKHLSSKCLKRSCSQYPNLSTACQQTYNHKSWKELWLFWTRFGPLNVLCATPGLGSQAPPECVSCKNSINEEWLLQLQLVQCLSAGPTAHPKRVTLAFLNKIWSISCTVCHAWAGLSSLSRVRLMQEFHQWRVVASAPTCPMLVRRPYCTA